MMPIRPSMILAIGVFIAVGTARAEDLPVAEPPALDLGQALCSIYGPGFHAVPGTDTCLKVGGRVRVDVGVTGGDFSSRASNTSSVAQGRARFETRTETDFGQVRVVIDKDFTLDSDER